MGFFWFLLFFIFAGGLADSRRQRVRYYRQARPSECPKRTGTTAGQWWRQQRKHRRSSRRCHAGRRRPHLPLSHECFAQRSKANAIRWSKGIFFQFSFLSTRFHIKKNKNKNVTISFPSDNIIGSHFMKNIFLCFFFVKFHWPVGHCLVDVIRPIRWSLSKATLCLTCRCARGTSPCWSPLALRLPCRRPASASSKEPPTSSLRFIIWTWNSLPSMPGKNNNKHLVPCLVMLVDWYRRRKTQIFLKKGRRD